MKLSPSARLSAGGNQEEECGMSKRMTAEERRAAGWRECWGTFLPATGWWCVGVIREGSTERFLTPPKGWKRCNYGSEEEARNGCVTYERPRRFWRRKKPKVQASACAPGRFQIGDTVSFQLKSTDRIKTMVGSVTRFGGRPCPIEVTFAIMFAESELTKWTEKKDR